VLNARQIRGVPDNNQVDFDGFEKAEEQFGGAHMKLLAAFMLGLASLTAGAVAAESPSPTATLDPTWRLAFNDDFDALSLRTGGADQVNLALGTGTWTARWPWSWEPKGSWPNGPEYTWFPDPSYPFGNDYPALGQFSIKDSILTIQAERTPPSLAGVNIGVSPDATNVHPGEQYPWVSGILTTYDSFSISGPAYVEGRIKISTGAPGVWPAFWALTKDWRSKGHSEVDFFEFFAKRTKEWQIHVFNGCGSNPACAAKAAHVHKASEDLSADFHVYGCLRTAKEFIFFLDGKQVFKTPVPGKDFAPDNLFVILSLQVGSDLPGFRDMRPDKSTPSPLQMQVDYVRVWGAIRAVTRGKDGSQRR
jgi:Glycosyl hydrolases family 16